MHRERGIYLFGGGHADGDGGQKALLGGKGAGLAEMSRMGLPVPPGFTIPTTVSVQVTGQAELPTALCAEIERGVAHVEAHMGRGFGDPSSPLLLSVRSGARQSMPGMMDTILNVGLSEQTLEGLARRTGEERFAWDAYRRLLQMFGNVVLGVDHFYFEEELHEARQSEAAKADNDLSLLALRGLAERFRALIEQRTGTPFPDDPRAQLYASIAAVFRSWHNDRARAYRELNGIPHHWGTACNVQAMVFGNLGETSATGVFFTRNPSTGERVLYGEYLPNAQGEDVVAGIRTPLPLCGDDSDSLEATMPPAFTSLRDMAARLESHFGDMQDVEFTIEEGQVFLLQSRAGKRTAHAALRIAVEMAEEGAISREAAVLLVHPQQLDALLHPQLDDEAPRTLLARGLPASPGAATGRLAFTAAEAVARAEAGEDVILVRTETTPDDIRGMNAARAIVTARGGMTSHAAVVARQMGRCCVVGCSALSLDVRGRTLTVGEVVLGPADTVTVDGTRGELLLGEVPKVPPRLTEHYGTLMAWADVHRTIRVRANADTGGDASLARRLGAEGIGLARTEHMFFAEDRIQRMREMILAPNADARRAALQALLPEQREDFKALLRAMDGLPVTIRLLDPPLHEFLPKAKEDITALADQMGLSEAAVLRLVERLHESNPMLGHRGCRLGITAPEIYEMQCQAIAEATLEVEAEGVDAHVEIMVPLIAEARELERLRARASACLAPYLPALRRPLLIGTMIELPRACMTADAIAAHADFFSFGTNDLTQTVYGISRDDAALFLPHYLAEDILPVDPFMVLDRDGVGSLIQEAVRRGRSRRPDLKIGICGEHGGEPASVAWLQRGLVDYVSCSPYRVPIARLAAAQAALRDQQRDTHSLTSD